MKFFKSDMWYNLKKDPVALFSFVAIAILIFSALFAPVIAKYNPYNGMNFDILDAQKAPIFINSPDSQDDDMAALLGEPDHEPQTFILGTDDQGRDLFSALLYGLRTSLIIGLGAVALQVSLGVILGLCAGYLGKAVDTIIMRIADVELSFSSYMIAIMFGAIFQMTFGTASYAKIALPALILVIGLSEWPQYARTVRASVMAEKNKEYVEAARIIGLKPRRIMFRHILPNTLTPVLVISTVQVANAIMSEAALSFLGLGMPSDQPSLGSLIKAGFLNFFSGYWWITLFPGLTLVILILSINLLGDWLREYLNPKIYKG